MTTRLVKPSNYSISTSRAPRPKIEEKDILFRFPEIGPLENNNEIKNYSEFLEKSKLIFLEKSSRPFISQDRSLEQFDQVQLLGSGSFGQVILIKEKDTENFYAMKALSKEEIVRYKQVPNVQNEKLVLQSINYPLTIYLVDFFKDNSYIYFVLPFVSGGELFSHLKKEGKFDEDRARFYACQVILALEYLHSLDLVYRDLKPENILMDQTGYLKLADFGFCKRLKKRHRTYTLCGTPEYIAPEVVLNKGHGKAVDWWAVGVFVYELVAGQTPFFSREPVKVYEKIVMKNYRTPPYFSPDLKDLVRNLLQVDLSKRYGNLINGVNDIKKHKWMSSINWLSIANRTVEAPFKPKCSKPGDASNFESETWKPLVPSNVDKFPVEFQSF